ncbi:MAG: hypothetical protein DDG60_10295 [Anaerolineae bacterium]|nr:MAG: hypothetical protein DDG60_10295 [Anaerolineae bacterium]
MRISSSLRSVLLTASLLFLLTGCISLAEDVTPPPGYSMPTPAAPVAAEVFPPAAPDIANGAAIYAEKCAPCHGLSGQGDGPQAANLPITVPALGQAAFAFDKSPARWYTIVTQGNLQNFMPGFTSLSDQERWNVVAYALTLSTTAEQIQAGKALYEVNCASCHGLDGRQLSNANLADQKRMAALSNQQILSIIQKGIAPAMPAANLSEEDAASITTYVRTFTFAPSSTTASTTPETPSSEPATTPAPSAQRGTISGKITNGSGGPIPVGQKVTLHAFIHDVATQQFTEGETRQTIIAPDGSYTFQDVSLSPRDAYYVSLEYSGVTYESNPAIPANDGLNQYDLPITIYDTTTDTSELVISTAHILFEYSQPGVIQVVEYLVFANMGQKTIVAAEAGKPVIEIPLPPNYQNLQFEDGLLGERYLQTANGFGDTLPIPPTDSQSQYAIIFAFELPNTSASSAWDKLLWGPKLELQQKFNFKTGMLNLLVPQGVKAEGPNLTDGGIQNMGSGFTFQLYRAGSIEAGQTFSATISGTPTTSDPNLSTGTTSRNIVIGLGAFGIVLLLAGIFLYLRDRQQVEDITKDETLDTSDEEDSSNLSENDILDAIIALDDQFRAGNISEEAYQARRAELKAMLKQ